MTHTDVLLGITERKIERALQEEAKAYKDELIALQGLVQHPGWHVFVAYCQQERLMTLARLEKVADPTQLAKLTGLLLVQESFPKWPARRAEALAEALKPPTPEHE